MIKREFHINQFPQDRIFVLLGKEFHKELFDYLEMNYTFEDLNKLFDNKLNWSTFKSWKYRRKKLGRKISKFIPLWFVTKIPSLSEDYYTIKKIEENIVAYKGPSSSSIIWNPNLPLVEDGRLLKILAHLMGDGHVGGAFGTGLPKGKTHSEYRNYNKNLLDQFVKDIQVFGKVNTSINYGHGHVMISNSIGYIIEHIYRIKTGTLDSKLPKKIYRLPRELVANFIRAFGDDEGHVYDNHIDFYSINKILLNSIRYLIKLKFPGLKLSELKVSKKKKENHHDKYYFYILAESREAYLNLIGFDHPEKQKDLLFNIRRVSERSLSFKKGKTKRIILGYLKERNLTPKQLSRLIGIAHGTVIGHLNQLKGKDMVKIIGKGKRNDNIWTINSKYSSSLISPPFYESVDG